MRQFFHLFFTDVRWFVGTIFASSLIVGFFWRLIDPVGFTSSINSFINDVIVLVKLMLVFVVMVFGIMYMFGWKPFGKKKTH